MILIRQLASHALVVPFGKLARHAQREVGRPILAPLLCRNSRVLEGIHDGRILETIFVVAIFVVVADCGPWLPPVKATKRIRVFDRTLLGSLGSCSPHERPNLFRRWLIQQAVEGVFGDVEVTSVNLSDIQLVTKLLHRSSLLAGETLCGNTNEDRLECLLIIESVAPRCTWSVSIVPSE
jgi:hypothetical protein